MAAGNKNSPDFQEIMTHLKAGEYAPAYLLWGEETYFTDQIVDYITAHALKEEEKDFNLVVYYGNDTNVGTVINTARKYPMGAARQVVVVKEAQQLGSISDLVYYFQHPSPSTVLVLCFKAASLDRRMKYVSLASKIGICFESKKLRDYQLPAFIGQYVQQQGMTIDPKATQMLAENIGTDLHRLAGEVDKLHIVLGKGNRITAEHIEQHIGISKDFNNFELRTALIDGDVYKANQIIRYFAANPRSNPLQVTLSTLFAYFSQLLVVYYQRDKSARALMQALGLRGEWQINDYLKGLKRFTAMKTFDIIRAIRYCDAHSKGIDNVSTPADELLKGLVYFILH